MESSHPNLNGAAYEAARLKAVNRYKIVDTAPEEAFDDLARLASQIFKLPICMISFIDADQVFYKSNVGLEALRCAPKSASICTNAMMSDGITVVEDVYEIPQFKDNEFGVRFYAGAPLITADGYRIGTICLLNYQPMSFDEDKQEILSGLAKVVLDRVELRLIALNEAQLKEDNSKLTAVNSEIAAHNDQLFELKEHVTQANAVLENRQENFDALFDQAPVATGISTMPDLVIRKANTSLMNLLGEDMMLIGESLEEVFPDVDGQLIIKLMAEVYATGRSVSLNEVKLHIWQKDHINSIYVNLVLQPLDISDGKPAHIIFMLTDVTAQVTARQLNEEANLVLNSAIEAGGMGYTVVEFATGKMISNDQFKKNYGYGIDDEFHYSDLFDAMLPKYRQKIKLKVQEAIENNHVYRAEYEVRWADGTTHWIRAYGKPRYDIYGRASHIIGLNKIIDAPDQEG